MKEYPYERVMRDSRILLIFEVSNMLWVILNLSVKRISSGKAFIFVFIGECLFIKTPTENLTCLFIFLMFNREQTKSLECT